MANEAAYSCAALIFVILVVLFTVSMRTNARTRRFCQTEECNNSEDCGFGCNCQGGVCICNY